MSYSPDDHVQKNNPTASSEENDFLRKREREIAPGSEEQLNQIRMFSRALVHTMNNFLSAASGYQQLVSLKMGGGGAVTDPEAIVRYTHETEAAINQAAEFLAMVGQWAKPEPSIRLRVDLDSLAKQALERVLDKVPEARPRIQCDPFPEFPPFKAIEKTLRKGVEAILLNAIQATEKNNGLVRIWGERVKADEETWFQVIRVKDSGEGFPVGREEKAWVPVLSSFWSTQDRPGQWRGGGFGLPTAFLAAEAHGGKLTVANPEKGGSIFSLYIREEEAGTGD